MLSQLFRLGFRGLNLQAKFKKPDGDLLGLTYDDNHLMVEWCCHGRVLFSFERRGDALSCHFASDKSALRFIKVAIDDFAALVREIFPWCKMLIAIVKKPSVGRLIKKVGFTHEADVKDYQIYKRSLWVD